MRVVRLASWVAAGLFAAVVFLAASPVGANCTDNPECTPNADGSGCCNSRCMWKSAGATCRDEEDACHEGVCTAQGLGYVCVQPPGGGANARNGKKCSDPYNVCHIGECRDGFCSLADGFSEACPDTDGNECTYQCQIQNGKAVCVPPFNDDFATCFVLSGDSCQEGYCFSGGCIEDGDSFPCPLGRGICEKYECRQSDGACLIVGDPDAVCDNTSPDDCIEKFCTDRGTCRTTDVDAGNPCLPGDGNVCTVDFCDGRGSCADFHGLPNGTPCQTDTNNCTNETCVGTSPQCRVTSCQPSTTTCAVCPVACQNTIPSNFNCGCANQ